ncbi:MAG: hypothetical protein PHW60_08250 [Kiritimatiellae bacterium]|nr:hypothetical protein [Kiritimatiellia bacterium]
MTRTMTKRMGVVNQMALAAIVLWAIGLSGAGWAQKEGDASAPNAKQQVLAKQREFKQVAAANPDSPELAAAMRDYETAVTALEDGRPEEALHILNGAIARLSPGAAQKSSAAGDKSSKSGDETSKPSGEQSKSGSEPSKAGSKSSGRADKATWETSLRQFKRLHTAKVEQGQDASAAMNKYGEAEQMGQQGDWVGAQSKINEAIALLQADGSAPAGKSAAGAKRPSGASIGPQVASVVSSAVIAGGPYPNSPFGMHPARSEDTADPYAFALDIGVRFDRLRSYFMWGEIQQDINQRVYVWDAPLKGSIGYDTLMLSVPQGMCVVANISGAPYYNGDSFTPVDTEAYTAFVRAVVERYDGDGVQDMPGLKAPIKYWQVENEPLPGQADYADLLRITATAIKAADPAATVLAAGIVPMMDSRGRFSPDALRIYKKNMIEKMSTAAVDVFDIHYYGNAVGDYRKFKDLYDYYRQALDQQGLSSVKIWVTEMGTYSGAPQGKETEKVMHVPAGASTYQSEALQAADVLKRYVFTLSLGVKKVFLAFGLKEGFENNGNFFDMTGLVFDGRFANDRGNNVPKIAYYTYKMMAEKLADYDMSQIESIAVARKNVSVYKISKANSSEYLYVAWWDWFNEPQGLQGVACRVELPFAGRTAAAITQAVTGLQGQRTTERIPVQDNKIPIQLGQSPVFVERSN